MRFRNSPQTALQNQTVIFSGGKNESVSNLEVGPGELFDCINYEELDGQNFGYLSTDGYERTDGQYLPSSKEVVKDFSTTPPTINSSDRDSERLLVTEIPGANFDPIGIFEFNGTIYALRSNGTYINMHKMTGSGWSAIAAYNALNIANTENTAHISLGRYNIYSGYANEPVAVICTGSDNAVILREDDTVEEILGLDGASDPLFPIGVYPYISYEFNDRLFLGFPNGELYFSSTGNPTDFDPATFGGVYFLKNEITDLITAPNTLVAFCDESIHLISKTDINLVTGIDMAKEVFNDQEGAIANTAQKVMGRIVYCSREGITTLDTTASYGDFEQAILSKKVQKTFDARKDIVTDSSVIRDKSQYRLYFSDGYAICLTFNVEKLVKGATILKYNDPVVSIWESSDDIAHFISTDNEFALRRSSDAESFDGLPIYTLMQSAFYHYKTPAYRKTFSRLLTEVDAEPGTRFSIKPIFDYEISQSATLQTEDIARFGGTWNAGDVWGESDIGTENPNTLGDGWTNNGDDSFTCDGSQAALSSVVWTNRAVNGTEYAVTLTVTSYTAGSVRATGGGLATASISSETSASTSGVASSTGDIEIEASADFEGTVELSWAAVPDAIVATWGVGGAVQQLWTYINGVAYNMSIQVYTSLKDYEPHVIHNSIVTFNRLSIDY